MEVGWLGIRRITTKPTWFFAVSRRQYIQEEWPGPATILCKTASIYPTILTPGIEPKLSRLPPPIGIMVGGKDVCWSAFRVFDRMLGSLLSSG